MVPSAIEHDRSRQIALLNDSFRTTFVGGTVCVTAGLELIGEVFVKSALLATRDFKSFEEDNDPHHEHDFGAFEVDGRKLFWKIDYYNTTLDGGSEDPADETKTTRVLTIMLASEY